MFSDTGPAVATLDSVFFLMPNKQTCFKNDRLLDVQQVAEKVARPSPVPT